MTRRPPIKPGTLCMIVNLRSPGPYAENNGVVVTAVRLVPVDALCNWWLCTAGKPFLLDAPRRVYGRSAIIGEPFLLPLSDPDADVETFQSTTEELRA